MRSLILSLVAFVLSCQPVIVGETSPYGMTTAITPVIPPVIDTAWVVPSDGETANSLSLQLFVQPLVNATEGFRQLTYGGGLRRRVSCTSDTNMVIQPMGAVVVQSSSGDWTVFEHSAASTVNPTTISGGLVAATRFFVYAFDNAGTLDFVAVTTAPDVGLRYEVGNPERFLVTTFYVGAAGSILPYSQVDNVYQYLQYTTQNRVLNAGSATGATTVSLVGPVPSQALICSLKASWTSTVNTVVTVRTTTAASNILVEETTTTGLTSTAFAPHSLIDGLQVDYLVGNAAAALTLHVAGFTM